MKTLYTKVSSIEERCLPYILKMHNRHVGLNQEKSDTSWRNKDTLRKNNLYTSIDLSSEQLANDLKFLEKRRKYVTTSKIEKGVNWRVRKDRYTTLYIPRYVQFSVWDSFLIPWTKSLLVGFL